MSDNTQHNWTEARVEQLSKLYRDGMSASQIARILGHVSRNAVIGKAMRLGLADEKRDGRAAAGFTPKIAPRYTAAKVRGETARLQKRLNSRQFGARPTNPNPIGAEGVSGMKARVEREAKAPKPAPTLIDASKHVTLMGLKPNHCRWPMTDHEPGQCEGTLFCAAPKAGEGSYCPYHARRAVDGTKPSERDLVRSVRRYA